MIILIINAVLVLITIAIMLLKLQNFERYVMEAYGKEDMSPLTEIQKYLNTINEYRSRTSGLRVPATVDASGGERGDWRAGRAPRPERAAPCITYGARAVGTPPRTPLRGSRDAAHSAQGPAGPPLRRAVCASARAAWPTAHGSPPQLRPLCVRAEPHIIIT